MKIYFKLRSKIKNNKARIKTIVSIISVVVGLRYGKIKTGSGILIDNQEVYQRFVEEKKSNLLEENNEQVILAKFDGNPVTPPINRGPSNFPTPPSRGRSSSPVYVPKYRIAPNPVGAGNGNGNGNGAPEFDDPCPVSENQKSKVSGYDYPSNVQKKKKKSQDQCLIDEQNKAGIDELPDSSEFIYNLETKTARQAAKKVWKNPEARKEVLAGLDKIYNGELLPRHQKNFKGFKTLKELKFTKTRMLVEPGRNGGPDQIVAIFMRRDIDKIVSNFKNKYK